MKEIAVIFIIMLIVFAFIYAWIDVKRYEKQLQNIIKTIKIGQIYTWSDPFGSPWSESIDVRIDDLDNGWVKYSYMDGSGTIGAKSENFIEEGWKLKNGL